jgi:hypothetical protein
VGAGKNRNSLGRRYATDGDAKAMCIAHMNITLARLGQTLTIIE